MANRFSFTLNDTTRLVFDSLTSSSLNWTLSGPRGLEVGPRRLDSSDASSFQSYAAGLAGQQVLTLSAGTYTVTVSGDTFSTGSYQFRLLDLKTATPFIPGDIIDGVLPSGDETDLYRFSAQAGDQVVLTRRAIDGGQTPWWRLVDPYGEVVYWGASEPPLP